MQEKKKHSDCIPNPPWLGEDEEGEGAIAMYEGRKPG